MHNIRKLISQYLQSLTSTTVITIFIYFRYTYIHRQYGFIIKKQHKTLKRIVKYDLKKYCTAYYLTSFFKNHFHSCYAVFLYQIQHTVLNMAYIFFKKFSKYTLVNKSHKKPHQKKPKECGIFLLCP